MIRTLNLTSAALLCLSACATTREERVRMYQLGAVATGHAEMAASIAAGAAVLDVLIPEKQPRKELKP